MADLYTGFGYAQSSKEEVYSLTKSLNLDKNVYQGAPISIPVEDGPNLTLRSGSMIWVTRWGRIDAIFHLGKYYLVSET